MKSRKKKQINRLIVKKRLYKKKRVNRLIRNINNGSISVESVTDKLRKGEISIREYRKISCSTIMARSAKNKMRLAWRPWPDVVITPPPIVVIEEGGDNESKRDDKK